MKLWRMRSTRIGHLAANTEYFLRKKFPGKNILICSGVPANKALLDIFARKIKIVLLPKWKSLQYITRKITRSPAKVFFKELVRLFASLIPHVLCLWFVGLDF